MKPLESKKLPYLVAALLALGAAWWMVGRETTEPIPAFKDEATARNYLKSEVAAGNMTQVEAQLRLAEAKSSIQKRERKTGWRKAYAAKIKEIMEEMDVSEEEAKKMLEDLKKGGKGSKRSKAGSGKKENGTVSKGK